MEPPESGSNDQTHEQPSLAWGIVIGAGMSRPALAALLLATLMPSGVGASEPAPEPLARSGSEGSAPAWDRPILADPKAPPAQSRPPRLFRDHGVGPTIDTTERPRSAFTLDFDTASFGLARAALDRGELPSPAEVRVEHFTEVFATPPPNDTGKPGALGIEVDAVASPQRRGYQLVRVTAYASAGPPRPVDVVIAVDVSTAMSNPPDLDDAREAVQALGGALTRDDRFALVELSSPPSVLVPLGAPPSITALEAEVARIGPAESPAVSDASLSAAYALLAERDPARDQVLVLLGSGMLPKPAGNDPRQAVWSLAHREAEAQAHTFTVGLGQSHYDDVLLTGLANAGRGAYVFGHEPSDTGRQIAQLVHRPIVALDPVLEVEFDPAAVTRYRLVGFESRRHPAPSTKDLPRRGALRAGGAVTALYEVKLRDGAPTAWGQVRLRYADPRSGKNLDLTRPLDGLEAAAPLADASVETQLAVLAAASAEKLRASYWARSLAWAQLGKRFATLPSAVISQPDVQRLGQLIDDAARLDQRPDRFEASPARGTADFERQPVVR